MTAVLIWLMLAGLVLMFGALAGPLIDLPEPPRRRVALAPVYVFPVTVTG